MKDDFGDSFDAARRFSGVPMSQGEVISDNDWNAGDGTGAGAPPAGGDAGEDSDPDRIVEADDPGVQAGMMELLGLNVPVALSREASAPADNGGSSSPGTGKTLSPEILADPLQLENLGLHALVDRYTGETENNLARVLGQDPDTAQTEESSLFDEDSRSKGPSRSDP